MNALRAGLAAALCLAALASLPVPAAAHDGPLSEADKAAVEALVRDWIARNPEAIIESIEAMRAREEEAERLAQAARAAELEEELERDPRDPVLGNPDGDVTLVEFFDYQCGFCKRMLDPMLDVARLDGGVRLVMKEFPILGPVSVTAARAALAARAQGGYEAMHIGMMRVPGRLTEEAVFQIAREAGLDVARLVRDMEAPEIGAHIARARELAGALSINGTPAFVIAGEVVPGAVGGERLAALVARARAGG